VYFELFRLITVHFFRLMLSSSMVHQAVTNALLAWGCKLKAKPVALTYLSQLIAPLLRSQKEDKTVLVLTPEVNAHFKRQRQRPEQTRQDKIKLITCLLIESGYVLLL
jgi:hypothetical protein